MVDTARHFLPLSTLKRQISAVSVAKMSVLHLHVPDSQSFPLRTETAPGSNFAKGCWKTRGVEYVQTLAELRELGQWAKDLGVFVMVEFDMPGHAASWGKADPELVCRCGDVVSPASSKIYEYIRTFIKDVFDALYAPFGFTPMIHLGGDEVNSGCFGGDPVVSKLMREHGWTHRELWQDFHAKVAEIIRNLSRELYPDRDGAQYRFYWQESFSNGNDLSSGGVVHAWMNTYEMGRAADRGYYVVRSQGWYLDINQPGRSRDAFQDSWMDFYDLKVPGSMTEAQRKFLLGGGGCQWGEKVHNFNIDEQIWPRAIAISEVLWSEPEDRRITSELKERLNALTCKLRQAGIESGAIVASAPCPGVDPAPHEPIPGWRAHAEERVETDEEDWGWSGRK